MLMITVMITVMDHGDTVHVDAAEDVELMVMISDSQVMGGNSS